MCNAIANVSGLDCDHLAPSRQLHAITVMHPTTQKGFEGPYFLEWVRQCCASMCISSGLVIAHLGKARQLSIA